MIPYGGPQLASAFRTVRGNTIQIAEEIPEEHYGFTPVPGWRSIGALLTHIAQVHVLPADFHRVKRITTIQGYDFPAIITAIMAEETKSRTKAEIIEALRSNGEDFASWLESLTPEFLAETYTDYTGANARSRFENLLSAKEHEMHHRGQLMLMQRMIGLVPHLTRAQMERFAARAAATPAS
jgi:uncharacterized damage-inducible protein DinB